MWKSVISTVTRIEMSGHYRITTHLLLPHPLMTLLENRGMEFGMLPLLPFSVIDCRMEI